MFTVELALTAQTSMYMEVAESQRHIGGSGGGGVAPKRSQLERLDLAPLLGQLLTAAIADQRHLPVIESFIRFALRQASAISKNNLTIPTGYKLIWPSVIFFLTVCHNPLGLGHRTAEHQIRQA